MRLSHPDREPLVLGLITASLFAFVTALRPAINRRYEHHRRVLDDAQIPKINVARAISLGHREWIADILWVNAALYYGETLYAHLPAVYIRRYTETMIALDPKLKAVYGWGANSMVLRTVAASDDDVILAGAFLRRGLQEFPDDPDLTFRLGTNLAFELSPRLARTPERRRQVRAEAAEYLRRASLVGAGPPYLPLTASAYLVEAQRPRDAIEVLRDGLIRASDPTLRDYILQRLDGLGQDSTDDANNQLTRELEDAHLRDYPFIPMSFYLFVGEPSLHLR